MMTQNDQRDDIPDPDIDPAPAPSDMPLIEDDPTSYSVPDEFWGTRRLRLVRDEAWGRGVRPEALLASLIANLMAAMDPRVVTDDIGKGYGPINLFVGLVANSGGGKSTALSCAERMMGTRGARVLHPSTGEGIHAHFRDRIIVEDPTRKDAKGKPVKVSQEVWTNRNGLALVDEIASLEAKASSHSRALMSELRTAYSGGRMGTSTKSTENRLSVPARGYRLSLVAGIQPVHAASLTDGQARGNGTFQRFLFIPAWLERDEAHLDAEFKSDAYWEDPANMLWPNIPELDALWTNPLPDVQDRIPSADLVVVTLPDHLRQEVKDAILAGQSLNAKGDIGHAAYHRMRWASALAVFDQHLDVRDADWERAGMLMELADMTVDYLTRRAAQERKDNEALRGISKAREEQAKGGVGKMRLQVADRVIHVAGLHPDKANHPDRVGCPKRCFEGALSAPQREFLGDVLVQLVAQGDLLVDTEVNKSRARYTLPSSGRSTTPNDG